MERKALTRLQGFVAQGNWGYHPDGPPATEPAAFACLALKANGLSQEAMRLAKWLADVQQSSGAVGVTEGQPTPAWPTSLALLVWRACHGIDSSADFSAARRRALDWALKTKGKAAPQQDHIGHDTTLDGWSWAADTHSWLEPTCFFVLALKAAGQDQHNRTRQGVKLIVDRLLDSGGCNFGNTRVLHQATLPHIQPTGLAMLAMADEGNTDPRIERSLEYLEQTLDFQTATASLCFGLLGLTAHGRRPRQAIDLLQHAFQRDLNHGSTSCYKLSLLVLASLDNTGWLPTGNA